MFEKMTTLEKWLPLIETERTHIHITQTYMAETLLDYKIKNRDRFQLVEPHREANYYELQSTKQRIENMQLEMQQEKSFCLIATLKNNQNIIASVNFVLFRYAAAQSCSLGYSIDQDFEGQGLMYEIVKSAIEYVRDHFQIHRITADHLVQNHKSQKILARLGFEKIGLARSSVFINGQWQDQISHALIFDN